MFFLKTEAFIFCTKNEYFNVYKEIVSYDTGKNYFCNK